MTSSRPRPRRPPPSESTATSPAAAPTRTTRKRLDTNSFALPLYQHPIARHLSDASSSSTVTFRTTSTNPSSISGFIEDPVTDQSADEHDIMDVDEEGELALKIEMPEEDVVRMEHLQVADSATLPRSTTTTPRPKRSVGRPRKHPLVDPARKGRKGRSKTGCITCRKRKKKCDEAKPGCSNCQKNNVVCEGYHALILWQPGCQRGREDGQHALMRRLSLSQVEGFPFVMPQFELAPIIHGLETRPDQLFLDHFCFRLSAVLTVEADKHNAFQDMLLPLAVKHLALMHSILALSSCNIDYNEPYGRALLDRYDVDEDGFVELEQRAEYHQEQALVLFNKSVASEQKGVLEPDSRAVLYGQIMCRVIQNLAEGTTQGQHRLHLRAFWAVSRDNPIGQAMKPAFEAFLNEFFLFHTSLDDLISLPNARYVEERPVHEEWHVPGIIDPEAVRLLGVQDGLFYHMSKITNIRNTIRDNMAQHIEPVVDYASLFTASEIDAGIRAWKPSWQNNNLRDLAGLLYKQMMWVYLWRTIYPPRTTTWQPEYKITEVVNKGLQVLGMFPPRDPVQTLLLAPTFIIGCAAFDPAQRPQICRSIANIKEFTHLKNADRCLQVLRQVWIYMDDQDERSWDWQSVSRDLDLDFLPS